MQQSTLLRFCLVDFFPLWHSMLSGPIGAPAAHKSILQHSRLMPEQPLTFFAFRADINAHSGLHKLPNPSLAYVFLTGWDHQVDCAILEQSQLRYAFPITRTRGNPSQTRSTAAGVTR